MLKTIQVTVLVDNSVPIRGLLAEHGLAFHVQSGPDSLLFDTGQSCLLIDNAKQLGIDLSPLKTLALSHGHYDHTGGLRAVRECARHATVYAHPGFAIPRYVRDRDGTFRSIGITNPNLEAAQAHPSLVLHTRQRTEVLPDIFLTGEIPRQTDFEDTGGPFFLDESGTQPDPILDDQALFFDTHDGVVVLPGCAHAGIVNTLLHVNHLTHGRPIHAVLGGMHLINASPERISRTVAALRNLGIQRLAPSHCTGMAATACLWHEFPQACTTCAVASRFVFHR